MSRFFKKQGFTLIELMVVIVIIGVLASLAIPRFTEASSKAKVAEAPRVIGSFESAYLALIAESGNVDATAMEGIIFDTTAINKESKWWLYKMTTGGLTAQASVTMGKVNTSEGLKTTYNTSGGFDHSAMVSAALMKKYVPNFFR